MRSASEMEGLVAQPQPIKFAFNECRDAADGISEEFWLRLTPNKNHGNGTARQMLK